MASLLAVAAVSAVAAAVATPRVSDPAEPNDQAVAERLAAPPSADIVSIFRVGDVDEALLTRVREAAEAAGAEVALARSAQAQVTAVRRDDETITDVPAGWALPFSLTILPIEVIDEVMGPLVSSGVGRRGTVAMARSSANMHATVEGDVIDIRESGGGVRSFVVNRIVPDDMIGGTELVMTDTNAATLGLSPSGRVVIHGITSREQIDAELDERGLIDSEEFDVLQPSYERIRVRRSWTAVDPDITLGLLQTKLLLGEFAYVVRASGTVSISPEWIDDHVACDDTRPVYYCRALLDPAIPIKARCHDEVMGDLRGAFAEIVAKGLAAGIDVANANSYGGCFYPRFNRLSTNPFSGSLSRHSWAMALDTNTTTNAQGTVPRMDCRIVRIFRKWGFSWGGNYLTPDGMHFEWVGAPRHRISYPSKYCPNTQRPRSGEPIVTQRPTFFSQDGWVRDDLDH